LLCFSLLFVRLWLKNTVQAERFFLLDSADKLCLLVYLFCCRLFYIRVVILFWSIPVIAKVARGQQEGLQYSRDNNITQNNNVVKGE
jgi:hypothetical protein